MEQPVPRVPKRPLKQSPFKKVPPEAFKKEVKPQEALQQELVPKNEGVKIVGYAIRRELWRRTTFLATKALPTAAVYGTLLVAIGCEQQEFLQQLNISLSPSLGEHINIASPAINAFVTGLLGEEFLRPFSRFNQAAEQKLTLQKIADGNIAHGDVAGVLARYKAVEDGKVAEWLHGNIDKKDRKNPQVQLVQALRNAEVLKLEQEGVSGQEGEEQAQMRVVTAYKTMQELAKEVRHSDEFRLKRIREKLKDVLLPTVAASVGTAAVQEVGGPVVGALVGLIDDAAVTILGAQQLGKAALPRIRKVIEEKRNVKKAA